MKKFNSILFLVLFINLLYAQNPLVKQWDKRFGGPNEDYFFCLKQTFSDGGFILGGSSYSGIGGDKTQATQGMWDYWIVKTDSDGNKEWDKRFGGTSFDELFSLQQTSDGGFILGGYSWSGIGGDKTQPNWDTTLNSSDYWIVKTDPLGNKEWDKRFGGLSDDFLYSLQQTTDGGFILGGRSSSGIGGDKTQQLWDTCVNCPFREDYWIVKTDSLGNKQWDKRFGGLSDDYLLSIEQTSDGGFILGGYSWSGIGGNKTQATQGYADYWIVKTDSLGNQEWDKRFGGAVSDVLYSLQQTSDGGFILGGYTASGIGGDKTQASWGFNDYWVIKTDSLGNKEWDKDFGGTSNEDEFGNVFITADKGFLFGGTSYSSLSGDKTENNLGHEQTWIVKTDSLGNKQWDKTIFTNSGPNDDEQGLAIETKDGCYVFANLTQAGIGGYKTQPNWDTINPITYDYWFVKFCDTTLTTLVNQITNPQAPFLLYPNPTNAILNLFVNIKENIIITNLLGEIVLQKSVKGKIELNVSFLSAGIYFIKAGNEVRKFVKE